MLSAGVKRLEMTKLYSGDQVKAIDEAAISSGTPGIVLMKRAGRAAFEEIIKRWPDATLLIVCGSGNNAGDGYVIAALAEEARIPVKLFYLKPPGELSGEAKSAAEYALQENVEMHRFEKGLEVPSSNDLTGTPNKVVIVDALLGTGVSGELSNLFEAAVHWMNNSRASIFSVDVPSGLSSDTGVSGRACVRAELTMSFIGRKRGLYTADGPAFSGQHLFDDLNVDKSIVDSVGSDVENLDAWHLRGKLARRANTHKGSYGHVAIIGGERNMGGAAIMAAEACLMGGAGLTSLYTRDSNLVSAQVRVPEVMANKLELNEDLYEALASKSVLCVGPGLGQSAWSKHALKQTLANTQPKVLDADALNLISSGVVMLAGQNHVLTPHPGEAARLLKTDVNAIQSDRFKAIKALQKRYGGIVVLKGSGSLVCDGQTTWVCGYGNPAMAVGGMGDVLAGLISALLAQGLSLVEAAQLGVALHSAAADKLTHEQGEIGLRATELTIYIRKLLNGKINIPAR